MATSVEGDVNTITLTTSQDAKVATINQTDGKIENAVVGRIAFDLASLSGTQILTESQSENGIINVFGASSGNVTLEVNATMEKNYWIRDSTTGGNTVTFQPTGGSGILLPKTRWILVRVRSAGGVDHMVGWPDDTEAAALSFGAAYQVVSGRPLTIYKSGAEEGLAGGMVHLEGAVEETTTDPVAGDTIVTLPATYRPVHTVAFAVVAEAETPANSDVIMVEITTGGAVIILNLGTWGPATITNAAIDLSGINFLVGN